MPGYQYLDNNPRMDAIHSIEQTGGGLATALPQLQMQAQAFRQRMALQRAQELLNDQRMNESKARAKLYEGEQKLRGAQTEEVNVRTQHTQGQEERERNIAQAALYMGQAMSNRYQQQQMGGAQGPPTGEQDATMQAIQAAGLLSAKNPDMMSKFVGELNPQKLTATRPGEVMLNQQGQPVYTNTQPYAASERGFNLGPGQEHFDAQGQAMATNTNVKAAGGLGPAAQAILARMKGDGASNPSNMAAPPTPGTVYKGYRFKGGDPAKQENWDKVQ